MPVPTTCTRRLANSCGSGKVGSPPPSASSRPFRASARTPPEPSRRSRSAAPSSRSKRTLCGSRPAGPARKGTCRTRSSALASRRPSLRSCPGRTPARSTRRSWSLGKRSVGRPDRPARSARPRSRAVRIASSRTRGRYLGARSAAADRMSGPRSSSWPTAVGGSFSGDRRPVSSRVSGSFRAAVSSPASGPRPRPGGSSGRRRAFTSATSSRSGPSGTPTATSRWSCTPSPAAPGGAPERGRGSTGAG